MAPRGSVMIATDDAMNQLPSAFAGGYVNFDYPVEYLLKSLRDNGFDLLHVTSIGEHAWLARTHFAPRDAAMWLTAYQDGLLDYFMITARTSG